MWDPHTKRDINLLEGVQKFALRVCFKQYSGSYEDLLSMANLLKERRTFLKLCAFYKIYMGYFIFSHSLVHRPSLILCYHHNVMFTPVYACTNFY